MDTALPPTPISWKWLLWMFVRSGYLSDETPSFCLKSPTVTIAESPILKNSLPEIVVSQTCPEIPTALPPSRTKLQPSHGRHGHLDALRHNSFVFLHKKQKCE